MGSFVIVVAVVVFSVFHGAGTAWLTEIPTYAKIHGAWDAWKIFK